MRQWTSLHYAAYNGYKKVCNQLLKWEADKDILRDMLNSQGKKAIHICKNPETKEGFKHIWRACRDGDLDLVRILIREGQDMNEQTTHLRNTPLHIAAKHGHFLIVKYLKEAQANLMITNKEGLTPFDFAGESRRTFAKQQTLNKSAAKLGGAGARPQSAATHSKSLIGSESMKAVDENVEAIKRLLAKGEGQ